jgi:ABC-type transport system involved in multi-copper enzyme maturation permease subunit
LVAVYLSYHETFPHHDLLREPFWSPKSVGINVMARMAEKFVEAMLVVQTAAIFVLAPAYLSGAIAEEKERRTLELLFTTHVSDREIVLGKLMSRVCHLGGVFLSGLPMLAVLQLWGGVDFLIVVAAFLVTGLNLLSIASICMFCSVHGRSTTEALFSSYAVTIVVFGACTASAGTPIGVYETMIQATPSYAASVYGPQVRNWATPILGTTSPDGREWESFIGVVAVSVALNGLVIALATVSSIWTLRAAAGLPTDSSLPKKANNLAPASKYSTKNWTHEALNPVAMRRTITPSDNWPLLWKETKSGGEDSVTEVFEQFFKRYWRLVCIAFLAISLLVLYLTSGSRLHDSSIRTLAFLVRLTIVPLGLGWCITLAFRAASGISQERDKQTLEGLLTLPVSRSEILGAKWLGPILFGRGVGYLLAAVILFGLLTCVIHPLGAILLVVTLAAHLAFFASLGMWLSLTSSSTVWARVTMSMILLLLLGAGVRLLNTDEPAVSLSKPTANYGGLEDSQLQYLFLRTGANMPGSWWFLAFSWNEYDGAMRAGDRYFFAALSIVACGTLVFALIAAGVWAATYLRFRGQQRR